MNNPKQKKSLRIVADENIQDVSDYFSMFGELRLLPGRAIMEADLSTTDVLLVRSVTQVNRELLHSSPIKFVGSATIGVDHVDQNYLAEQGITFAHAPGCNADAVVQYVFSVIAATFNDLDTTDREANNWNTKTVGILGCGNVGGRLYQKLRSLGIECRCYDPLLNASQQPDLCSFDEVLQADIVTLHAPLTMDGANPTWHLLGFNQLMSLKEGCLLINTSRGSVIDNKALLKTLSLKHIHVALDVWEGEPAISLPLLAHIDIATPHIAGYSHNGKLKGTEMIFQAFCQWGGVTQPDLIQRKNHALIELFAQMPGEAILQTYDVRKDDQRLRDTLLPCEGARAELMTDSRTAQQFDKLRKEYAPRPEFNDFVLNPACPESTKKVLGVLGFNFV